MKVNPIESINKTTFNIKQNPNRQHDKQNKNKKKNNFAEIFEKTLEEKKKSREMSEGDER